jgi:hypothetical protein
MIYLTKEEWNNLILKKLSNEESFKKEFNELFKIYNAVHFLVRNIYSKPVEQQNILNAVQIIFHKYRICSGFSLNKYSSEELYIILGACLFIGQKAINILGIRIDHLSKFIRQLILKKDPNKKIEINEINNKLKEREMEILTIIGFNIYVDFPFPFFNKIKTIISNSNINSDNFITLLNYFIKDSFILPLSLYYTPNTITISCVYILKQKYNLHHINLKELISQSEYDLDEGEIQECASLIQKLEAAITEKKNNQANNNKIASNASNINTNNTNTMNSEEASVTKIIPSIKMNIN